MRKEKYVVRNITITRVKYQTNQSNEIYETKLIGSFTRREALEELREILEDSDADRFITQIHAVMEETITCKVKQSAFVLMSEYNYSGPQLYEILHKKEAPSNE